MLDLRKRIFLGTGIVAGLIIVSLLLYLFVFKPGIIKLNIPTIGNKVEQQETGATQQAVNQNQGPIQPIVPTRTAPDELYAKQVAQIFVERFGSYSNQNNNAHLADVLLMATPEVVKWLKTQAVPQNSVYQGRETKVISSSVTSFETEKATVLVDTQIIDETATSSQTYYRSGRVELVRAGADWKVSGFYWNK